MDKPTPFDVFISHFTEEQPVAEELQEFLSLVFGPELRVFRSSDDGSIQTGADQYPAILEALRSSPVYVVLISKYSASRPWINFEVGFGKGKEAKIFPVLIGSTTKGEIPAPLSELELRELAQTGVVKEILEEIENRTGKTRKNAIDPEWLLQRVRKREAERPARELTMRPFISEIESANHSLKFELIYKGSRPVQLVKEWAEVPLTMIQNDWPHYPVPGHLTFETKTVEGKKYLHQEYVANLNAPDSRRFGANWVPLHPHLQPNVSPQPLRELRFRLSHDYATRGHGEQIRCQVVMGDGQTRVMTFPFDEIERRGQS